MRWWYEQDGQTKGPVEDGELRSLVEQGTLNRNSRVIQEGSSDWTTVEHEASSIGVSSDADSGSTAAPTSGHVPGYTGAPATESPAARQSYGAYGSPPSAGKLSITPVPTHGGGGGSSQDHVVLTIGDIGISRHWIVTPNGTAPLGGSVWIARDMSRTERRIPPWAIVLAVFFALFTCGLGLLFLLVKEDRTTGYVEVSVQSGSLSHVTQLPISGPLQVVQARQLVHQAQTMVAAAGS